MTELRPLHFRPLEAFINDDGDLVELKDPDGLPTWRQWSTLNRAGCIVIVEPGTGEPLKRADAAGAIAAAKALDDGRGATGRPALEGGHPEPLGETHLSDDEDEAETAQPRQNRTFSWP